MRKLVALLSLFAVSAQAADYPYPTWVNRWESDVTRIESQPAAQPGGVVVLGNSNIVLWSKVAADLSPLPVVKRGFGGSTAIEADYYLSRLVLINDPRAVIICEGENDLFRGYQPQDVVNILSGVIDRIRAKRADTDIVLIALKPSPLRWSKWSVFQDTDLKLKALCSGMDRCLFVDPSQALLKDGVPDGSLYRDDRLHLNATGYVKWNAAISSKIVAFLSEAEHAKVPKAPSQLEVTTE